MAPLDALVQVKQELPDIEVDCKILYPQLKIEPPRHQQVPSILRRRKQSLKPDVIRSEPPKKVSNIVIDPQKCSLCANSWEQCESLSIHSLEIKTVCSILGLEDTTFSNILENFPTCKDCWKLFQEIRSQYVVLSNASDSIRKCVRQISKYFSDRFVIPAGAEQQARMRTWDLDRLEKLDYRDRRSVVKSQLNEQDRIRIIVTSKEAKLLNTMYPCIQLIAQTIVFFFPELRRNQKKWKNKWKNQGGTKNLDLPNYLQLVSAQDLDLDSSNMQILDEIIINNSRAEKLSAQLAVSF